MRAALLLLACSAACTGLPSAQNRPEALLLADDDDADVLLTPVGSIGADVSLILLPAPGFLAVQYTSLGAAVQAAAASHSLRLFVGIVGGSPTSVSDVATALTRVETNLAAKGLPGSSPSFHGAHSPASALAVQQAAKAFVAEGGAPTGLVLLAGFIARSLRGPAGTSFPIPVLTMAAELDGVARLTRTAAEPYYTQITYATNPTKAATDFPVVVVPGANHISFTTGTAPAAVLSRDLKADVDSPAALSAIASSVASFLASHGSSDGDPAADDSLREDVGTAGDMVAPLISAMEYEGSRRLRDVCNSDFVTNPTCGYTKWPDQSLPFGPAPAPNPLPSADCICGSPFVASTAQALMAGFASSGAPTATADTRDAFHDVSDVHPFHLPHIFNSCNATASAQACVLNTTTVTMPVYKEDDTTDMGIDPLSAYEFRTKLKSRQAMWQAVGLDASDVNATDGSLALCRAINQASWDWALKTASSRAKLRFDVVGEPMQMVDDVVAGIGITGPEWIKDAMVYKRKAAPDSNRTQLTVQSFTFKTGNTNRGNVPFIVTAGYHYCKLLSPFRAMEWIFIDGIRQYGSLANTTAE